jgi:amidase
MPDSDLLLRSAIDLAALVRGGEVTATELTELSLRSIDERDGEINAFTVVSADAALETAAQIGPGDERPFAGVPLAMKDLFATVAGQRMTCGSSITGDSWVRDYDGFLTRRLREAGFVIVGATSSPEFGALPITEPRRFGPTRNPWNVGRTPGGSSGGSGAAVAAGMVPIAHASDGGGSIRVPAACTGLVGLKPARGRVSMGPEVGESFLGVNGVLTRTVADTAAVLDVLAGYEPGDSSWAPPPSSSFASQASHQPGRRRVAVVVAPPLEANLDPAHLTVVEHTADLLRGLGHEVELIDPPVELPGLMEMFLTLWSALIGTSAALVGQLCGNAVTPETVESLTLYLWERANSQSAFDLSAATSLAQGYARALVASQLQWDAVLTPTIAARPVEIGAIDGCSDAPEEEFAKAGRFIAFTPLANLTGLPAISLPIAHGDDGLPVGVMLTGRPAGEGDLLSLASQLESAAPWSERFSPLALSDRMERVQSPPR